jgi:hypothetical protein
MSRNVVCNVLFAVFLVIAVLIVAMALSYEPGMETTDLGKTTIVLSVGKENPQVYRCVPVGDSQ